MRAKCKKCALFDGETMGGKPICRDGSFVVIDRCRLDAERKKWEEKNLPSCWELDHWNEYIKRREDAMRRMGFRG